MEIFLLIVLALILIIISFLIGKFIGSRITKKEIDFHRKDAISRSRAVIGGQFSENISPYLPNFPFKPTECKFLGKPIDFVVFKGLDKKKIEEIIFLEIKSGKSTLTKNEKDIREAVKNKKVRFEEYKIDEKITKE